MAESEQKTPAIEFPNLETPVVDDTHKRVMQRADQLAALQRRVDPNAKTEDFIQEATEQVLGKPQKQE